MRVQSVLKPSEYERFKEKARQAGLSESALAREGILIVTFQPRKTVEEKKLIAMLKEFFESGQAVP